MDFPDTIEGFGYKFSEDGKLQDIKTGKPFNFEVKKNDHSYNQTHYEALGELVTPYIYNLLEERCGLKKHPVPCDPAVGEPQTFIFCSKNFDKEDKLLILIHGSGVVRAGQWARRLIINDSLNSGTQIPFIERGLKEGYGIVVMNTNDNRVMSKEIRGSKNPQVHGAYVWNNYIRNCAASKIALVVHSFGGVVATHLLDKFSDEFAKRVFAIAMTDSVHFRCSEAKLLRKIGQNWVTSSLPLDSPVAKNSADAPCVSAGCTQHEMTSWSSFESIFEFFEKKLRQAKSTHSPSAPLFLCCKKKRENCTETSDKTDVEETDKQQMDAAMENAEKGTSGDQSSNENSCKKLKEDGE